MSRYEHRHLPASPASSDERARLLAAGFAETRVGGTLMFSRRVSGGPSTASDIAGATDARPDVSADTVDRADDRAAQVAEALSPRAREVTMRAGITASDLLAMSDEELLDVDGIGPGTLAKLRALAKLSAPTRATGSASTSDAPDGA